MTRQRESEEQRALAALVRLRERRAMDAVAAIELRAENARRASAARALLLKKAAIADPEPIS